MLFREQYWQIHGAALETFVPALVGRGVLALNTDIGPGAQEVSRDKITNPEVDAPVIAKGQNYPEMSVDIGRITAYIRKIGVRFTLSREDILSSQTRGEPLPALNARKAGRVLAEQEDKFIFSGDATVNETGILGAAGVPGVCAAKWNDPAADPYEDVNDMVAAIEKNGGKPRVMCIHPTDLGYLRRKDFYGNKYIDQVAEILTNGKNSIIVSQNIPKGTSLITDVGNDIAELFITEGAVTIPPAAEQPNDTYMFRLRERLGIDVYEPNVIGKLTNLS